MIGKTNSVIISGGSSENTLKTILDSTKQAKYLFENYKGAAVDDLIHYSDTENVTDMSNTFGSCSNLTTIPLLNTSKVTDMNSTFRNCGNLTTIPLLDTSKVTNMSNMFAYSHHISIPQLNTSNVTNMSYMFDSCGFMETIPLLNTSKATNMMGMFNGCTRLNSVPELDVSNVTRMNYVFNSCPNLKSILMTNIGVDLNISASTKFEREDLLVILNNLKTVTSSKTLTMGATNLAKLTDEDKAIATNKG